MFNVCRKYCVKQTFKDTLVSSGMTSESNFKIRHRVFSLISVGKLSHINQVWKKSGKIREKGPKMLNILPSDLRTSLTLIEEATTVFIIKTSILNSANYADLEYILRSSISLCLFANFWSVHLKVASESNAYSNTENCTPASKFSGLKCKFQLKWHAFLPPGRERRPRAQNIFLNGAKWPFLLLQWQLS